MSSNGASNVVEKQLSHLDEVDDTDSLWVSGHERTDCAPSAVLVADAVYALARQVRGLRRSLRSISIDTEEELPAIRDALRGIEGSLEMIEGRS